MKIFIFLFAFSYGLIYAQNPGFAWAKQFKASVGRSIATDIVGNVYTTGPFFAPTDFDPGPAIYSLSVSSPGMSDIYVSKLDVAGNFVWAKKMGGNGNDDPNSIEVDDLGNIYTAGKTPGGDFDPGPGTYILNSISSDDMFISKLDAAGNFVWAKNVGSVGTNTIQCQSMTLDDSANVFLTGIFGATVMDFDPGPGIFNMNSATGNTFILKLNSAGNFVWAKQIAYPSFGKDIVTDNAGNVYVTGHFSGTADFDPGIGVYNLTAAANDIFVFKMDPIGNFLWAKQMGGSTNADDGKTLSVDANQNVYSLGLFNGTADFDPGPGTYTFLSPGATNDMYISKLDALGNFVWAKQFAGIGSFTPSDIFGISLDIFGNVYSTGSFQATSDFDPGLDTFNLTPVNNLDVFISKLDFNGNFSWVAQFLGQGDESGADITIDLLGNVISTGYFSYGILVDTVDFDPGPGVYNLITNSGTSSTFVHKMGQCMNSYNVVETACDSFSFSNQTYTSSGNYSLNLPSISGCDSIVYLDLTINHSTSNSISASACSTYVANGQSYFSTGTYSQILPNAAGCDSMLTLNLTINNTYATITDTACNSYTFNGTTYTHTGTFSQAFPNASGCYDVTTLHLVILPNSSSYINQIVCDSFILNAQTYTSTGVYSQTIPNAIGCDSIITLDLTVNNNGIILIQSACGSYNLNAQTYTSSGTYTQNLTNMAGCDSTITLNLVIDDSSVAVSQNGVILTAVVSGASYQWINCDIGYSPIAGEINQSFTSTVNGNYGVIITNGTCVDTSACFAISSIGINEMSQANNMNIFPNPTNGIVTIHLDHDISRASIKVVDIAGKTVLQKSEFSGDQFMLDISQQASGIYLIELNAGENTYRIKLIKN